MDARGVHCILQSEEFILLTPCLLLIFVVQLETDPSLLITKARRALERYGHQVVVGNDLNRRKYEVVFVSRPPGAFATTDGHATLGADSFEERWLRIEPEAASAPHRPKEIEEDIVAELVARHQVYIDISRPPSPQE